MKHLLTSLLVVFFLAGNAQQKEHKNMEGKADEKAITTTVTPSANENEIYTVVDEAPEFQGGMPKLYEFIIKNFKYPQKEREAGIQGRVFVRFVIEKDGSIGNTEVLKGVKDASALDDEAVRVVKSLPSWKPGKVAGKAVRTYYNLPISIKLDK